MHIANRGDIPKELLRAVSESLPLLYVQAHWDLGCRIGEIVGLDYSDVTRDQFGFVLQIRHSKTVSRKLKLITPIGMKYFMPFYVGHDGKGALFKSHRQSRSENRARTEMLSPRQQRMFDYITAESGMENKPLDWLRLLGMKIMQYPVDDTSQE